jgi:hypothetical protein
MSKTTLHEAMRRVLLLQPRLTATTRLLAYAISRTHLDSSPNFQVEAPKRTSNRCTGSSWIAKAAREG